MNKLLQSRAFTANFSIRKGIFDALYINDPSSPAEKIINASISLGLSSAQGNVVNPAQLTYRTTKLASGITVLTESVGVPSNVNLGILVNIGSRDETIETSGAMLSLKNTYLKTSLNTNEAVNYGVAQMAGGEFEMDYNRESAYYRCNCLSHDVVDVFSVMADCAFEPKSFVSANVGIYKNNKTHQLESLLGGNQYFNDDIYATAFGRTGLGNPINGNKANISNLTAFIIQEFQNTFITPENITISAAGIENHQQFVDLVSEKMFFTQLSAKNKQRQNSSYIAGEVRTLNESSTIHVSLSFEGASHKEALPLLIAQEVLGNNRKSGRIQRNILNKNAFVDGAQAYSTNYEETGLFGLKVSGSASHAQEICEIAAKELSELRNLTDKEVSIAKQTLKGRINRERAVTWRRLQDISKSVYYTGSTQENVGQVIDGVSVSDVQSAVNKALNSKLTLVAQGAEVNRLKSYDSISNLFK